MVQSDAQRNEEKLSKIDLRLFGTRSLPHQTRHCLIYSNDRVKTISLYNVHL